MKKRLKFSLIFVFLILIILFVIRIATPKEIDDINPLIYCEDEYIKKSQILWVIPYYKDISISENKTWCEEIKNLNKTIGLHGYRHNYHEFKKENLTREDLLDAIKIFEDCFGETPTMFKPPQLEISKENIELLKSMNIKIRNPLHQTIHKVYHCDNTGTFSNKFHDIF